MSYFRIAPYIIITIIIIISPTFVPQWATWTVWNLGYLIRWVQFYGSPGGTCPMLYRLVARLGLFGHPTQVSFSKIFGKKLIKDYTAMSLILSMSLRHVFLGTDTEKYVLLLKWEEQKTCCL